MEVVIAIVIVALVAAFVAAPLRTGAGSSEAKPTADPVRADLEAAKQAKYREIRDTELDHAQGKLSDEEFQRQNRELRAEAIAILERLDELDRSAGPATREPGERPT